MLAACVCVFAGGFRNWNCSWDWWNAPGDLNEAKERIGFDARTHIVTTLSDAREQIRMLVEPRSEKQVPPDGEKLVMAGARK